MPLPVSRAAAGAVAAIVFAGLGLQACTRAEAQAGPQAPPTVTVASPLVRLEPEWSEHAGRFVAAEAVDVRPRVSGYLQAVHFRDGQYVRKGQLLFTIDPLPFQAQTDRARAELAQAEARLELARSDLRRAETLRAADAISAEEFDARKGAQAQAIAARAAAQAALTGSALDLGYTHVYAPISGRISDRRVDPGNLVQNSQTVLTQIVSVDPIHFEFSASDALPPTEASGAPRQALIWLEGETGFRHAGRLDFVDNRIDAGTGAIRGRVVLDNADGAVRPGQFGRVRVLTSTARPTVLAPDTAIGSDQSRKFVLVVNTKNVVEYRQVELGPQAGALRVVRRGLGPSDRIVINGVQRAQPGQKVTPTPGRVAANSASLAASAG